MIPLDILWRLGLKPDLLLINLIYGYLTFVCLYYGSETWNKFGASERLFIGFIYGIYLYFASQFTIMFFYFIELLIFTPPPTELKYFYIRVRKAISDLSSSMPSMVILFLIFHIRYYILYLQNNYFMNRKNINKYITRFALNNLKIMKITLYNIGIFFSILLYYLFYGMYYFNQQYARL